MVFKLRDNYNNVSGLEFDMWSFLPWGRTAKENKSDISILDEFNTKLSDTNVVLKEVDITESKLSDTTKGLALNAITSNETVNGQKTALTGLSNSLKKTSLASKAAALGMSVLNAAMNMGIGFIISESINWAIKGITFLATQTERAAENSKEALEEYSEAMDSVKKSNKFIADEKTLKDFIELSKGVSLTGENLTLTNTEFEKYHEIANQIAELFPNLVKGWDSENNAILKNKNTLNEYIDALKEENKLKTNEANEKLLEKEDDTWDTFKNEGIADFYNGLASSVDGEYQNQLTILEIILKAYKQYKKEVGDKAKDIGEFADAVTLISLGHGNYSVEAQATLEEIKKD